MKIKTNATAFITAIKMMLAGLMAFLLTTYFQLPMGVWALVTIAAITQTGLSQTLAKSLMRASGTLIGAVIGYTIAVLAHGDVSVMMISLLIAVWFSSYIALQPTIYSYAGIITGMTIAIILFFSIAGDNYTPIAVDRTAEVMLGVFTLTILNIFLFFIVKKYYPKAITRKIISWKLPKLKIESRFAIPATKVSLACFITFVIWYCFKQPEGYWATIGFLAVILLLHYPYTYRLIPLLITFFLCGYLIGTENQYAGMGNTSRSR